MRRLSAFLILTLAAVVGASAADRGLPLVAQVELEQLQLTLAMEETAETA